MYLKPIQNVWLPRYLIFMFFSGTNCASPGIRDLKVKENQIKLLKEKIKKKKDKKPHKINKQQKPHRKCLCPLDLSR